MNRLLLLANPAAGGRRARALLPRLRQILSRQTPGFDYFEAASSDELRAQARAAAREGFERVLAAGGDGTAHAALSGVQGSATALGILPLGHGNDLARAFGVPLEPEAAAEFLARAPVSSVDVCRVGAELYAGVAGVGLDSEANRRANAWGPWPSGHARYLLAGLRTLATYRPLRVELESDTETFAGEVMWLAVTNTPNYGGGMRIAPRARPDDGALDVCVIERMSRASLLCLYPRILRGEHLGHPSVRYFQAKRVSLRAPAGAELFGDGEFLARLPVEIRLEAAALRVLRRAG